MAVFDQFTFTTEEQFHFDEDDWYEFILFELVNAVGIFGGPSGTVTANVLHGLPISLSMLVIAPSHEVTALVLFSADIAAIGSFIAASGNVNSAVFLIRSRASEIVIDVELPSYEHVVLAEVDPYEYVALVDVG